MKVGVVMPIGPQDGTGVVPPWEAIREAALATEEAGFDSAWVYDHVLFRFWTDPTQGPGVDGSFSSVSSFFGSAGRACSEPARLYCVQTSP